jgi:pyridoxamine 5'-phosphate oxidase family protein
MFSEAKTQYLKSQRLARIATVSRDGQPDVVPVGFEFDGKYFWVGSHSQDIFHQTLKYHNVKNGNKLVALTRYHPTRGRFFRRKMNDYRGRNGPDDPIRGRFAQ